MCILHEWENHINVSPVSIWDVKEPLRMTCTLAVACVDNHPQPRCQHSHLGLGIERSGWHNSEKDLLVHYETS